VWNNGALPATEAQFDEALRSAELSQAALADPWGHPYYVTIDKAQEVRDLYLLPTGLVSFVEFPYSLYVNHNQPGFWSTFPGGHKLVIRSLGPDGGRSNDDFDVAVLVSLGPPEAGSSKTAMAEAEGARSSDGSIGGAVRSPAGKLLAGVAVTLVDAQGKAIQVLSSEAGAYEFASLKPGSYRIKVDGLSGVITQIPVESGKATRLDLEIHDPSTPLPNGVSSNTLLNPDMISEIRLILAPVDAEAGRGNGQVQITTKSGSHFSVVDLVNSGAADEERVSTLQGASNPRMNLAVPLFTPRLREYFPETLVWEPAVETDRDGRAELRFKLADNITAWKVETIASTLDGRIARGETEFLAFQPFFLEHEPPRILTEGDTIALPVTIRNYLATDQLLDIAMSPESWFTATGSLQQKTSVKAGETAIATFGFKATRSVKDAKQRITAIGTAASDSIEKPLTVHPNGREVSVSESKIVNGRSAFALDVPASALPGSTHAQIWIYPNLAAHIAGAIEGILERPHGCAEQVISSTYPSLMLLRVEKQAKRQGGLTSKARAYLENGYARLIGYQSKDGGFTYWGSGDSDIALTAYAVQFLADARDFIAIDENTLERAANWLASRQRDDGSWFDSEHTAAAADPSRALALTNTVAQALSLPAVQNLLRGRARESAGKALRFARSHTDRWTDPYGLAQLTLAALHQSDRDTAETALRRIEELARAEGDGSSWDLEGSSPFFGWGLPGRVESSALSIRALVEGAAAGIRTERTQTLIDRGLAFLMRHKDRYGVWFSTQATARALDTLSRYIGTINGQAQVSGGGPLEILIDGKRVHTMQLPRGGAAMNPIPFDISTFLRAGANRMEISSNGSAVTAQIVGTYYVPWTDGVNKPAGAADASDALQLAVTFDKTEGRSTDTFTAHVRAARGRSRGYGMMLAEIGLPPGAEVDRESLDRALAERGSLFRYEIRPDRVVAYLWPASGHADFQFSFHMRFGAEAESAPSILYDYYNPDDQVVQAPTRFVVR
jgi:hypothetical protein